MFVVSLALAAVLLAGGDDDTDPPRSSVLGDAVTATAPATLVVTATNTPEPTATPIPPLAFDLQQRLDTLPEKLRNETLAAYSNGGLDAMQLEQIVSDYENRNPNVRVGSVLGISDAGLRFAVFTTGEQVEVATVETTLVRRAGVDIALEDLAQDELVMVVSTDDGTTALTIEAFGVAAQ